MGTEAPASPTGMGTATIAMGRRRSDHAGCGMDKTEFPALDLWRLRCLRATRMHYDSVTIYDSRERWLTIGNVAASILILVLSTIHIIYGLDSLLFNSLIAVFSPVIVVTSILQYVLDYKLRAQAHSHAGSGYAALNRKIESLTARGFTQEDIREIRQALDTLGQTAPVPHPNILRHQRDLNEQIRKLETALSSHLVSREVAGGG